MPNMIACFKWVVDEAYVRSGASGDLDLSSVDYKISDYDKNALEEAVAVRERSGGVVTAVTVGVPEAGKGIKDALSRGPDKAFFIRDPAFRDLEPSQTAAIMAEVIRDRIPFDLILCGEGSSDLYARQVGPRLAEILGIPCLTGVQKISIEGNRLVAERRTEEGVDVAETVLPALVTVLPDINTPRIPGVRDTLMASKKETTVIGMDDLPSLPGDTMKTLSMKTASLKRQGVRFTAQRDDVAAFVDALVRKGVLE